MFATQKEQGQMDNEESRGGNKGYRNVRAVLHIGMGGVYLLFGGIIIAYQNFGTMGLSPTMAYVIGGLMLVYGGFRLYRGFADMREMRRERKNRL
jgi:hypothetical protein